MGVCADITIYNSNHEPEQHITTKEAHTARKDTRTGPWREHVRRQQGPWTHRHRHPHLPTTVPCPFIGGLRFSSFYQYSFLAGAGADGVAAAAASRRRSVGNVDAFFPPAVDDEEEAAALYLRVACIVAVVVGGFFSTFTMAPSLPRTYSMRWNTPLPTNESVCPRPKRARLTLDCTALIVITVSHKIIFCSPCCRRKVRLLLLLAAAARTGDRAARENAVEVGIISAMKTRQTTKAAIWEVFISNGQRLGVSRPFLQVLSARRRVIVI